MLSKIRELVILADDTNYTITTSSTTLITYYETTITKSWKIHVNLTAMVWDSWQNLWVYTIYANDTKIRETSYNSQTVINYTSTDIYPSWTTITIKIRAWYSTKSITTKWIYIETIPEWYTLNQIAIYPKEIKNLWNLVIGTIYGSYNDNKYIWGIMLNKATTATTGSVTLWNAVGFITVDYNGEILKIPYYNE